MITFKEFKCKSIYGGDYYMDNSFKILSDDKEIGVFHFQNADNCEVELSKDEMYLEYIKLYTKGFSREVLRNIFTEFYIKKIVGETNDENKAYWGCIGAKIDKEYSDECRGMYNFKLSIDDLKLGRK